MSIGAEVDLNKEFGCQDMTGNIKRVLIKDPQSAYKNQENIDSQYEDLNYFGKPKFEQALKDYSLFRSILENNQIEILTANAAVIGAERIYVYGDSSYPSQQD